MTCSYLRERTAPAVVPGNLGEPAGIDSRHRCATFIRYAIDAVLPAPLQNPGNRLGARLVASIIGFPAAGTMCRFRSRLRRGQMAKPGSDLWRKSFRSSVDAGGKGSGVATERFRRRIRRYSAGCWGRRAVASGGRKAFRHTVAEMAPAVERTTRISGGRQVSFRRCTGRSTGHGLIVCAIAGSFERDRPNTWMAALASTSFNRRHCAGIDER